MTVEQVGKERPETTGDSTKYINSHRVKGERGSAGQLEKVHRKHGKQLSKKAGKCWMIIMYSFTWKGREVFKYTEKMALASWSDLCRTKMTYLSLIYFIANNDTQKSSWTKRSIIWECGTKVSHQQGKLARKYKPCIKISGLVNRLSIVSRSCCFLKGNPN